MPIYCFVPECTTTGTNGFHRFPTNPQRRQEWMENTKTVHIDPSKDAKICRKHFKIGSPKKRRFKRLKKTQEAIIADDNIGNEVEVGMSKADENVDLGPYINIEYLRYLEEKILQQTKCEYRRNIGYETGSVFPAGHIIAVRFVPVGWLKVAEVLINPFGVDDEDIDLNFLIDLNVKVSYTIVDEMHDEYPELMRDQYWDEIVPKGLPYTVGSAHYRKSEPKGSAHNYKVKPKDVLYAEDGENVHAV